MGCQERGVDADAWLNFCAGPTFDAQKDTCIVESVDGNLGTVLEMLK